MEVDTGAAVSIVSGENMRKLFTNPRLCKSSVILRIYTSERMIVLGELTVTVEYGAHVKSLDLVVVAGDGPNLLVRNWLERVKLQWPKLTSVVAPASPDKQLTTLLKYKEIFRDELGTVNTFVAKLQIHEAMVAKFCKA